MNIKSLLILLTLSLAAYTSCKKENVDQTDTHGGQVVPDTTTVNCDSFTVAILLGQDSSLNASTNGGTAPYSYSWSTGDSTQSILYYSSGTISVTVTDANGCTTQDNIQIDPGNPCATFSVSVAASPTGQIAVTATGGEAPYTYIWSNGAAAPFIQGNWGTTYTVTVTESNGCTGTASITLTFACDSIGVLAIANSSGIIFADVNGGLPPYIYNWSNGGSSESIVVTNSGLYTVTVTDANGCTGSDAVSFVSPNPCSGFNANISIDSSAAPIYATVHPIGGSAPYNYYWNTGSQSNTIPVTIGNAYTVTASDSQGCSVTKTIQL